MIWFHLAINLCSVTMIIHALLSWRINGRRHRSYRRRADVMLRAMLHSSNAETWRVLSDVFDANTKAWGRAIDRPWWQRDPIDEERI